MKISSFVGNLFNRFVDLNFRNVFGRWLFRFTVNLFILRYTPVKKFLHILHNIDTSIPPPLPGNPIGQNHQLASTIAVIQSDS